MLFPGNWATGAPKVYLDHSEPARALLPGCSHRGPAAKRPSGEDRQEDRSLSGNLGSLCAKGGAERMDFVPQWVRVWILGK